MQIILFVIISFQKTYIFWKYFIKEKIRNIIPLLLPSNFFILKEMKNYVNYVWETF